jgi:hypothetical protein
LNSNASAGSVGETNPSNIASSGAAVATSATPQNVGGIGISMGSAIIAALHDDIGDAGHDQWPFWIGRDLQLRTLQSNHAASAFRLSRCPSSRDDHDRISCGPSAIHYVNLERVWVAQSEASPLSTPDAKGALFRYHSEQMGEASSDGTDWIIMESK